MFPFSLPCIFKRRTSSPCCRVGGYDICRLHFTSVSVCECEWEAARTLVENGFDEYRLDPVATAARYLSSPAVPCDFRGKPAYLKCMRCISGKTYVVLGVSCVGDAVFELVSETLPCNKDIYTVCRVAFICN